MKILTSLTCTELVSVLLDMIVKRGSHYNFVYKCRVDKNGSIYNAIGILKKGIIHWEKR